MDRRDFVRACAGAVAGSVQAAQPPASRPPNVLLALIDDLGWMDLGCQGSSFYETPSIDRLAREGARFTNAYSNCPVCSPSRAALMTGRYPGRVGFTGHITATGRHRYPPDGRILPPDDYLHLRLEEVTLAEAFRAGGYATASVGKWHLGSKDYWPEKQGFDVNVAGYDHGSPPSHFYPYRNPGQDWNSAIPTLRGGEPCEYLTDRLTAESIRFIEANRAKPFFLYLTHYAVHTPLEAPRDLAAKYEKKLKSDRSQKNAIYGGMVEAVDRGIGRIRAALERLGLLDNTIIAFTSDNGGLLDATSNAPLREGKGCLYEGGVRVPFFVRWPGRVRAGAVSDAPVMGADLYPTLLDLAGVRLPEAKLDGVSIRPVLEQGKRPAERSLFWYYPHYSPQYRQPGAAVRAGNLKLIEFYDPPRIEMYDLAEDPRETVDVASRRPKEAGKLTARLRAHVAASVPIPHKPNPKAAVKG